MRIITLCLTAALAASLTACDSGGSSADVPGADHVPTAKGAADAIVALGAIDTEGRATASGPVQPVRTQIDYRNPAMKGTFPPGVPTKPVHVVYRAKGDTAWFYRQPTTATDQIGLGPDLLILRTPSAVPWVQAGRTSYYANLVTRPWDPAFLLSDMADMPAKLGPAVSFKPSASAVVAGVRRPGFTTTLTPNQGGYLGIHKVTLWTDRKGVPVRLRVETPTLTRGTYDIRRRRAPVVVRAPAASQIQQDTPLPSASGPYVAVASGTAGTTPYQVLRAPASDGGTCWKVESNPPYVPQDEVMADGGVCVAPIKSSGGPFDQFTVAIDGTGDTPYEILGFLVPKGSTAEAVFFDGTRRPVPVDADGLALVTGPLEPVLGAMTFTLADGTKLECGPGTINGPADVGSGDAADAFDAPWNCLPA